MVDQRCCEELGGSGCWAGGQELLLLLSNFWLETGLNEHEAFQALFMEPTAAPRCLCSFVVLALQPKFLQDSTLAEPQSL